MLQPKTRYTDREGMLIAYQVFGKGDTDLIISLGLLSNSDHLGDVPARARTLQRLAEHFRVILFDRRGTGHSDPLPLDALPTWEEWSDDLLTVMEAAGSLRAVVFGERDGAGMAMLFAAMHPDRTVALALGNPSACYFEKPDYPAGLSAEKADRFLALFRSQWGTPELVKMFSPNMDDRSLYLAARAARGAATPRQAAAHFEYIASMDLRSVLPSISVPTIVFHRLGQQLLPIQHGRYVAEHIPGARLVELPGGEATTLFAVDDSVGVVNELIGFVTGNPVIPDVERALVTVLFCDIVDSTRLAADLGDQRWHDLLERFYGVIREAQAHHRGREVDTAGDGVFMAFDRPTRAILCAVAIRNAVEDLGLQVRCGLHAGECTSSAGKLSGMAVHVGARVAAAAEAGEIWVSETIRALAMGSGFIFETRGTHAFKGVADSWALYAVVE